MAMARVKQNVGSQAMADITTETHTAMNDIKAATLQVTDQTQAASAT